MRIIMRFLMLSCAHNFNYPEHELLNTINQDYLHHSCVSLSDISAPCSKPFQINVQSIIKLIFKACSNTVQKNMKNEFITAFIHRKS